MSDVSFVDKETPQRRKQPGASPQVALSHFLSRSACLKSSGVGNW